MDAGLLKTLGQIAGIGGIALGVALLLFHGLIKKVVFPKLTRADFRLLIILVWTIGVLGIGAWIWTETPPETTTASEPKVETHGGVGAGRDITVQGDIRIEETSNARE